MALPRLTGRTAAPRVPRSAKLDPNVRWPGWLGSLRRRLPGADWAWRGTQAPLRCLSGNEAIADRDRGRALELVKQHNISDVLSLKSPDPQGKPKLLPDLSRVIPWRMNGKDDRSAHYATRRRTNLERLDLCSARP